MLVPKGYCTAGISIFFGFYLRAVSQPASPVSLPHGLSDRLSFSQSQAFISSILNIMRLQFSAEFSRESNCIRPCILSLHLCIHVLFFILSACIASFYGNKDVAVFLKNGGILSQGGGRYCQDQALAGRAGLSRL